MVGKKTQKAKPARKKNTSRKKRGKESRLPSIRGLLAFFVLLSLLIVTVSVVGYVIFFRTVLAGELSELLSSDVRIQTASGQEADRQLLPAVAIIIDDIGYEQELIRKFLDFQHPLSYAFLPFAPYTPVLQETAHKAGKTVLLHLPLEPHDAAKDPGPGKICVADQPEDQVRILTEDLTQVPHAVGINNHMGSLFTENRLAMSSLLTHIDSLGLFFIDSLTSGASVASALAAEMGIPAAQRDVFLDIVREPEHICRQLEVLVRMAEKEGRAIGIAHPFSQTHLALTQCMPQYLSRVAFVSVAELMLH